jgi:hypothetical protein
MAHDDLRRRRRSIDSARAAGRVDDPVIRESWELCRDELAVDCPAAPVDCEPDEVRERWEASPIRRSGIGVEEQLGRAAEASDLIAAITDDEGRILWSDGGHRMRHIAEGVGFVAGGRWDETSAGTNALGLALRTGRPSTVFASQHWCESVHDWVCWSAPVTAPDGTRIGVLDLSGRWDTATPVAELAVAALARLVEEHLPADVAGPPDRPEELTLRLLGRPRATLGGRALPLSPRQVELLAVLAVQGPASLEQLGEWVYGDHPVSPTTIKAELSHLRRILGGAIGSRPYRLELPVRIDVTDLRSRLHAGDLHGATAAYGGQFLPDSEAPFAIDQRHVIDMALRRSLLEAGTPADLLRFAEVHRYDETVLRRALDLVARTDPLHHEAQARLDLARRG